MGVFALERDLWRQYAILQTSSLGFISDPPFGVARTGSPRFVPICSDFPLFFRFVPICVPCFRECPDVFRFLPICFPSKSGQIRATPFCRPLLQIPDCWGLGDVHGKARRRHNWAASKCTSGRGQHKLPPQPQDFTKDPGRGLIHILSKYLTK